MNKLKLIIFVIALLPAVALGQYNQGISNVSVSTTTFAPGDIVSVQFDSTTYTPPEPPPYQNVYWRIYLDVGTHYDLGGILLASGNVYHDGDPWLQVLKALLVAGIGEREILIGIFFGRVNRALLFFQQADRFS